MRRNHITAAIALCLAMSSFSWADPCGMVPPVYVDSAADNPALTRVGPQMTYLFYAGGVETMVLRPGFEGEVDEFGMLIPFPTPPEMRKMPDDIFSQIAKAVDPPEVVVDVSPPPRPFVTSVIPLMGGFGGGGGLGGFGYAPAKDEVRVVREEAVGSYEVAVLAAGSAKALEKWMTEHTYQYPKGMDEPVNDYVHDGWCFVAVKARVADSKGADPEPGQREIQNDLPEGSLFDGHVQAMEFRFRTDKLVAPMRLSAFNPGKLRNVVYILTTDKARIRQIPEEYVVRQIGGRELVSNLVNPLPLRLIGGTLEDARRLPRSRRESISQSRNPTPHNGGAAELFVADLIAAESGEMLSKNEADEKTLHNINFELGLQGKEIDDLVHSATKAQAVAKVKEKVADLRKLSLTIVDGDFPREVIARQNLTFQRYVMSRRRNTSGNYDAKNLGPATARPGLRVVGEITREAKHEQQIAQAPATNRWGIFAGLSLLAAGVVWLVGRRR